ncbi:MAG TPA: NUDIX domain-containing protein [Candidatus Paceibacterota bacterium]|nr:NUDIX domain-containing protein [Candidatus Paceibacterota bacterium]
MREISAGVIIYRKTKEGPKFLLLYHGGRYWNFPKGKIGDNDDEKESAFKAALREVSEETGLSSRDLRFNNRFKVYDRFVYTREKNKIFKIVVYYLAETSKHEIRVSDEHSGYGWFLYRDALRMLIHKNLKENLKRANEVIHGKSLRHRKENTAR